MSCETACFQPCTCSQRTPCGQLRNPLSRAPEHKSQPGHLINCHQKLSPQFLKLPHHTFCHSLPFTCSFWSRSDERQLSSLPVSQLAPGRSRASHCCPHTTQGKPLLCPKVHPQSVSCVILSYFPNNMKMVLALVHAYLASVLSRSFALAFNYTSLSLKEFICPESTSQDWSQEPPHSNDLQCPLVVLS